MIQCEYVIDRRGGGYIRCALDVEHDGYHRGHAVDERDRRIVGESWMPLGEWKRTRSPRR